VHESLIHDHVETADIQSALPTRALNVDGLKNQLQASAVVDINGTEREKK